jgi:hypothetical protein
MSPSHHLVPTTCLQQTELSLSCLYFSRPFRQEIEKKRKEKKKRREKKRKRKDRPFCSGVPVDTCVHVRVCVLTHAHHVLTHAPSDACVHTHAPLALALMIIIIMVNDNNNDNNGNDNNIDTHKNSRSQSRWNQAPNWPQRTKTHKV